MNMLDTATFDDLFCDTTDAYSDIPSVAYADASPPQDGEVTTFTRIPIDLFVKDLARSKSSHRQAAFDSLLRRVLEADTVGESELPSSKAAWALYQILETTRSERVDDGLALMRCVANFNELAFLEVLKESLIRRPPLPNATRIQSDYWYVLVRSLGWLANESDHFRQQYRSLVIGLSTHPSDPGFREAAVEALTEFKDEASLQRLREMASTDSDDAVRKSASEALADMQ
jgi:hypothetical protein